MPALSPTMTEGNIATWRIKEGDKFAAGDVLLEIETDKATMDVEAQEDGILMKIMKDDGSKGVQVGTRIAVIAEEGDDISTLQIPPDEGPKTQKAEAPAAEPASASTSEPTPTPSSSSASTKSSGKVQKQTYPLYPSVATLLKVNGLDASVADSIPATGPNGRLLKGDVLAYLGKINAETPSQIESRFKHASHLDLSNIKVAKAPEVKKVEKAPESAPRVPEKTSVSLTVSLDAVIEVQTRIQKTLGIFLPLSTFISRASELANEELPLPAGTQPTADELFDQILALNKVGPKSSSGRYFPQIAAFEPASFAASKPVGRKSDIIDLLAAGPSRPVQRQKSQAVIPGISASGPNLLSLHVPKTEERRAKVFLERLKLVLEVDPGRLVL